jgi:putative oxidoreductase
MGMLHQLEKWSTTHHPRWLVLLRVALGICLFFKGIIFISNTAALERLIAGTVLEGASVPWLSYVITWIHLLGGFLIIIGLLTRWAVLIQIPVLLGAVIFINATKGVFAAESEFGFSLVILLLLLFFLVEGGGPLSLDNYFRKNPK